MATLIDDLITRFSYVIDPSGLQKGEAEVRSFTSRSGQLFEELGGQAKTIFAGLAAGVAGVTAAFMPVEEAQIRLRSSLRTTRQDVEDFDDYVDQRTRAATRISAMLPNVGVGEVLDAYTQQAQRLADQDASKVDEFMEVVGTLSQTQRVEAVRVSDMLAGFSEIGGTNDYRQLGDDIARAMAMANVERPDQFIDATLEAIEKAKPSGMNPREVLALMAVGTRQTGDPGEFGQQGLQAFFEEQGSAAQRQERMTRAIGRRQEIDPTFQLSEDVRARIEEQARAATAGEGLAGWAKWAQLIQQSGLIPENATTADYEEIVGSGYAPFQALLNLGPELNEFYGTLGQNTEEYAALTKDMQESTGAAWASLKNIFTEVSVSLAKSGVQDIMVLIGKSVRFVSQGLVWFNDVTGGAVVWIGVMAGALSGLGYVYVKVIAVKSWYIAQESALARLIRVSIGWVQLRVLALRQEAAATGVSTFALIGRRIAEVAANIVTGIGIGLTYAKAAALFVLSGGFFTAAAAAIGAAAAFIAAHAASGGILLVIGLIAVGIFLLIKHWDKVTEAVKNHWQWLLVLIAPLAPIIALVVGLGLAIKWLWNAFGGTDAVKEAFGATMDFVGGIIGWISEKIDWLAGKLGWLGKVGGWVKGLFGWGGDDDDRPANEKKILERAEKGEYDEADLRAGGSPPGAPPGGGAMAYSDLSGAQPAPSVTRVVNQRSYRVEMGDVNIYADNVDSKELKKHAKAVMGDAFESAAAQADSTVA